MLSNKTKMGFSILAMLFATQAMAYYNTGPYINIGAGGLTIVVNSTSTTGGAGRFGLGYIDLLNCNENPAFIGFELNGNYGYTRRLHSIYGADLSGVIGQQLSQLVGIYGKLGAQAIGQDRNYILGPQIGLGLGFQVAPLWRVTLEGNYALDAFRIHSNLVGNRNANTFTYLLGLQ
ncbi:MAG: hypothetical protein WBE18_05240, partial [Gammaproteobacteria bacterium]